MENKENKGKNTKEEKEKEYFCKVCGRKLSKKGDICSYCYQEIKDYERKGFKNNIVLESLTNEHLEPLNKGNKLNRYKMTEKDGEKAFEISFIYSYLYDNLLKRFDLTAVLFVAYATVILNNWSMGFVRLIPLILSYIVIIILKHFILKKMKETKKVYFFNDRVVKENTFLRTKTEKIYYTKINDIKQEKSKILPYSKLYIEELMQDKLVRKYIEVPNITRMEELAPILVGITMLEEPKENTKNLSEVLKDSFDEMKQLRKESKTEKEKQKQKEDSNKKGKH